MTLIFAWLASNPLVAMMIAAVIGALGYGYQQRRAGAKAAETKQRERDEASRDIADQVQNDVGAMPDEEARKELAKWARR